MGQRELARCLKAIDAAAVVCCVGVMLAVVPARCGALAQANAGLGFLVPAGWAFAVVASAGLGIVGFALSHLTMKAALIKAENDLTV